MRSLPSFLTVLVTLAGCASSAGVSAVRGPLRRGDVAGALQRYEALVEQRDPQRLEALRQIAGAVLVREARRGDRTVRDRVFVALGMLGDEGTGWLRRLLHEPEPIASRARAALLRLGEEDDVDRLEVAVRSGHPEVRVAGLAWLREEERWVDVRARLLDVDAAVRRTALESLSGAPDDDEALLATVIDVLRRDPAPAVRAAAARLLSGRAGRALDALEQAIADDESLSVKMSATAALAGWLPVPGRPPVQEGSALTAARARAHALLRRAASGEPSAAGIEAARRLGDDDRDAVQYLKRALVQGTTSTRLQAVVAASGSRQLRGDLRERLEDASTEIRFRAAAALARISPADRAASRRVLTALLEAPAPVSVQAAVALRELDDARGLAVVASQLSSADASLRALAAWAIADTFDQPDRVRRLLLDRDVNVRISAARAILDDRT